MNDFSGFKLICFTHFLFVRLQKIITIPRIKETRLERVASVQVSEKNGYGNSLKKKCTLA